MSFLDKPWDVPCPVCGAKRNKPCKGTPPTAFHSGRDLLSTDPVYYKKSHPETYKKLMGNKL